MRHIFLTLSILTLCVSILKAQGSDKGKYEQPKAGFMQKEILKEITGKEAEASKTAEFIMDFDGKRYPTDISKYKSIWHNAPVSQGLTGTCWAYSATSFMESEAYRKSGHEVKLSEMYTVYWEYVARAEEYLRTKGEMVLGEGSESNAIKRVMNQHGLMPYSAYNGLPQGQKFNNHEKMFAEFKAYLFGTLIDKSRSKEKVIADVKEILDKYIGTPPEKFEYEGKTYTPETFMKEYLQLNPNDYFSFMSTLKYPYNEKHELEEPDNWWHSNEYYNIALTDYMWVVRNALENGYSVSLCGDTSEPGYVKEAEVGIIPTFDIPSDFINEYAREMRLKNGCTTDDHCIQIVGYQKVGKTYWYLIKDSGSGGMDGAHRGYRFYSEDYIKLKMINIMVNVDAARKILDGIIK